MKLWSRLAKAVADKIPAADDRQLQSEAAIFVAMPEVTDRASTIVRKSPQIRDRHFGPGFRGEAKERHVSPSRPRRLLGWLGLAKTPEPEAAFFGTQVRRAAASEAPEPQNAPVTEDDKILERLFGVQEQTQPPPPAKKQPMSPAIKPKPRKKLDRSDVTLAALGVTLALICALFPWYIFFNQEQFGVREFVFEGRSSATPSRPVAYQPKLVGKPFSTGEVPKMDLDFFPTATLQDESDPVRAVPASEQPFPLDLVNFRLVHVANGRAMIEDEDGLWVVQPGSRLPDASRVVSIEQRNGNWVLVTSLDRVVELSN